MASTSQIIQFLSEKNLNFGKVDKLKIKYRPLICPFDKLLSYADSFNSALDIGCGSGQFCSLLAQFTDVQVIHGIEIKQVLIDNAKRLNASFQGIKQLTFSVYDGKKLPNELGDYELVYMIDVFHHIPSSEQYEFLQHVHAKMKSGSRLVFKDINKNHPFVYFNKLHDLIFAGEIGKEKGYREMKSFLSSIGFEIEDSYTYTRFIYPHYFIIARKK